MYEATVTLSTMKLQLEAGPYKLDRVALKRINSLARVKRLNHKQWCSFMSACGEVIQKVEPGDPPSSGEQLQQMQEDSEPFEEWTETDNNEATAE